MRLGPKLRASLAAKLGPVQSAEDLLWVLLRVMTSIDLGEGVVLDRIGRIVGRGRGSIVGDPLYRVALRTQILVNRSNGFVEELLAIFRTGVNDSAYSLAIELGAMSLYATMTGPFLAGLAETIWAPLRRAKAAGVRLDMVYDGADESPFLWSADLTEPTGDGHGFGDTADPDVGGILASVLSSTA